MSLVLKLTRDGHELNLAELPFRPDEGFVPPTTAVDAMLAAGPSMNQYGGSRKTFERAGDVLWNLPLRIIGDGAPQINAEAGKLAAWLASAGDASNPLLVEHRSHAAIEREPLWGQYGANNRFEVIHADTPVPDNSYGVGTLRERHLLFDCQMRLAPFYRRKRQRLASATGGIIEDRIATDDGRVRGLRVPAAATNKMTNPIFGHSTWNNGWTATASLTATEETRDAFVLFGLSSARLTARSTSQRVYQDIDVANTNTHTLSCYVKLPDGTEPDETDLQLYYGSAQTTTFRYVGDGWYLAIASFAGVASSTQTGIEVKNGRTVTADGFMLSETAYAVPLAYGEQLGCAWTGTAHASTATRTAARVRIAVGDALSYAQGMVRLVWVPDRDYDDYSADGVLFSDGTMILHWDQANNRFEFTDGTNTAVSAALTFTAGDVFILHAVYSPAGGLELYAQGSRIAINTTYSPPAAGSYLYIGTSSSAGSHAGGTFRSFETYDYAPTPGEISADAVALHGLASTAQRVGAIPWLWTGDGDDVVDNADDGTYTNWIVVGGIDGDAPAITEMAMTVGAWGQFGLGGRLRVSNFTTPVYVPVTDNFYGEADGTVDANSSNGEYRTDSVNDTAWRNTFRIINIGASYYRYFRGKEIYFLFRALDTGSDLRMKAVLQMSGLEDIETDARSITIGSGAFAHYISDPIVIPDAWFVATTRKLSLSGGPYFIRTTGTDDLSVDFVQLMVRPLMYLYQNTSGYYSGVFYHSERGQYNYGSGSALGPPVGLRGDRVRVEPNLLNIMHFANDSGVAAIATTVTLSGVYATPRGRLL